MNEPIKSVRGNGPTTLPSPEGKPETLLRFFDSEHFDEWIAISYLWRTTDESMIEQLCRRMLALPDSGVKRYLSQIIMLQIIRPSDALRQTIVDLCGRSLRLATKTCWLLNAAAGDSDDPRPILELRGQCEQAALAGKWEPPFRCLSPMLDRALTLDDLPISPHRARRSLTAQEEASSFGSPTYSGVGLDTPPGSPSRRAQLFTHGDGLGNTGLGNTEQGWLGTPGGGVGGGALETLGKALDKIRIFAKGGDRLHRDGEDDGRRRQQEADAQLRGVMANAELAKEQLEQRRDTFISTLKLAEDLCGLSVQLSRQPQEGRQGSLRAGIRRVSDGLVDGHPKGTGVMFPMGNDVARVVRLPAEEAVLLNSREKAPYLVFLEVIHADDDDTASVPSSGPASFSSTRDSPSSTLPEVMGIPIGVHGLGKPPVPVPSTSPAPVPPLHPGLPVTGVGRPHHVRSKSGSLASFSDLTSLGEIDELSADHRPTHVRQRSQDATTMTRTKTQLPPRSPPSMSPKGVSPNGASSSAFTSIFSGNAASVKPTHLRTPSYENISRKVDRVLTQVYRGDEQIVRVSLAVMSERGDSQSGGSRRTPSGGGGHSRSGSGDSSGRWNSVAWFSGNGGTNKSENGDAASTDGSDGAGSGNGSPSRVPKGSHVRVTLFVENPAPGRVGPSRPPSHQRKPSDLGLEEMAEAIHHEIHAPLEALDATAAPPALTPKRPQSAGAMTITLDDGPGSPTTPSIPSPWKRSAGGLGEKWCDKVERVRSSSPYGTLPGWSLKPVIIKAGDNCRQELLAIQLTRQFRQIYRESGLPLWIRPFEVIAQSTTSAFIEAVTDAPSIHAIKSRAPRGTSLRQHFEARFGAPGQPRFRQAQRNFVESLAGYSILTYIQVKDRHNGNILLHDDGHMIHIDFNFMLSTSPGGINFESSPFKLTREYLEVMDSDDTGAASEAFNYYKVLCIQGYLSVRKHAERIVQLVEMMSASGCPCFKAGPKVLQNLRRRFNMECTEEQCVEIMLGLISDSMDAWCTRQYDFYQRVLNGIL